jgi:molecular chaperone DnaK
MVPHDLSLVLDDLNTGDTKPHCIFAKNSVIPAKTNKTVEVNRTVIHGSGEDVIRIIVVEGPSENDYMANRKQGELIITGKNLKRDLLRGTEIDLTFGLSESRELTVTAYINPSGPEFRQVFVSQYRDVDAEGLSQEVCTLEARVDKEMVEALASEKYEVAGDIEKLRGRVRELHAAVMCMTLDECTDNKFKRDDDKRKIAQELGQLTASKRLERLRADYQTAKDEVTGIINESGNDLERRQLRELVAREHTFLDSTNPKKLEGATDDLRRVGFQVLRRKPDFLVGVFQHLIERREVFNEPLQAKNLIEAGKRHIAAEDYDKLDEVIGCLYRLLPQEDVDSTGMRRHFTGIS